MLISFLELYYYYYYSRVRNSVRRRFRLNKCFHLEQLYKKTKSASSAPSASEEIALLVDPFRPHSYQQYLQRFPPVLWPMWFIILL